MLVSTSVNFMLSSSLTGTDHWYPCEYCTESFRLVGQLHLHRRQQHPGMRDRKWTLMCSICSKRFFNPEFATQHSDVDHKLATEKANKVDDHVHSAFFNGG